MFVTMYKWKQDSFQCFEFVLQTIVVYIVDIMYMQQHRKYILFRLVYLRLRRESRTSTTYSLFFLYQKFCRKENDMELKKRLSNYIKNSGLKKQFVAEKIGISPSKLSYYLHGKLFVTDDFADKIKTYLESVGA